jgi:eukaryotic-like serine/threonine-protein kinase
MTPYPAPERWRRIAPLLEAALELPAERRAPFLEQACGADAALRAEVEDLLRADAEAGAFLAAPVDLSAFAPDPEEFPDADALVPPDPTRLAGATIGPYRVVREIGRGGMGVVYEAEQPRPRRRVALKVILGGRYVDTAAIRMFQRETDSLARLKHPGIAAIYESGCTEDGQHFFAMELVQGRRLSDDLDDRGPLRSRADLQHRLALFRKISGAVAYAHQRGVIHRDLKPSNILVVAPPGGVVAGKDSGVPPAGRAPDRVPDIKVLDFGLARISDADQEAATAVTALGRIQGTLPYMSPEQVRGRRDEVDVRTDVYSLGVLLYRMLTGRLPYDLDGAGFPEAARIVCEQPPRPLGAVRGRVKFDRDLAIILHKTLEKDPARRYQTVAALDEDVERYLGGQPILARPPGSAYLIRKLIARHKVRFAAAAALLALLLVFSAVMTLQARRIAAERDRANRETITARRVSEFLTDLFKVSDPDERRGNAITAREILDKGLAEIHRDLADEPAVQARLMLTIGKVYSNLGLYGMATPILEQAVQTRRRLAGRESPETLEAMSELALEYVRAGHTAEAQKLYQDVLAVRRRLLGEDHPDTLIALAGLAWTYRRQGRYAEGERLDRQVLEARRRVLGPDHPDTLASMVGLANVYRIQRRYPEAEALFVPGIEGLRRVLGDDHPTTLATLAYLANVYERQGRHAEAEKLYRETLARDRRVLGEDHPQTLEAMNELALVFDDQGRYAEAEPLYRDTLARRRRVLGENHPDTLTSMNNLANVYAAEGRYKDAGALFRESLAGERRLLGDNHPDTTNTLYNLGCMAALRGNRPQALDWLGQAVAHGYSHWDVMARDTDLQRLRADSAFRTLVTRARRNADAQTAAHTTSSGLP